MEQRAGCFLPVDDRPNSSVRPVTEAPVPLQSIARSIGITKRRFKQLESVCLIREQRVSGCQEIAFNARPFVLCGLPLRRPPSTQLVHRRRNGKFFLHVVGHPNFGLPFGQDRLIPIWIATLAIRQKSREVHFDSAAEMLEFFRLPKDGPHYGRLVDSFKRLFGATILFGTEQQTHPASVIDWSRFHFFDQMKLWFNMADNEPTSRGQRDNVIQLSEAFHREIDEHRIPVERQIAAALAHAPGALDFYIWVAWKSWNVSCTPARVPLFGPNGLQHQLGACEYSADRYFRRKINSWLLYLKAFWPECPANLSKCGSMLNVASSKKSAAIRAGSLYKASGEQH